MDKQLILADLKAAGGNKTEVFDHLRGWLDIENTPQLDELYKIIDEAPGQWNMKNPNTVMAQMRRVFGEPPPGFDTSPYE